MLTLVEYESLLKLAEECARELMDAKGTSKIIKGEILLRYLGAIPNEEWDEFVSQVELNIHRKEYPQI